MTDFSGSGVDTTEERRPGKSIKPGIHVLKIADVEYFTSSQKGTPGIKFTLMTQPVEGLTNEAGETIGQKCTETWWLSPKAWDNNGSPNGATWCTKAKLAILADKVGVREQYDNTKGSNAEEFVNNLVALFKGKFARFAVGGEESEFTNDDGETIRFIRPKLLTFKFVESTDVADADTKLKYDENNPKHLERMEVADDDSNASFGSDNATSSGASGNDTSSGDAPW